MSKIKFAPTTALWLTLIAFSFDSFCQDSEKGFISLFNGKNLDGWIGDTENYNVENGVIVSSDREGGGNGNLFYGKQYSDFTLRFEFQLTPGANNGIGIHAPAGGDVAYQGKEIQVIDNTTDKYGELKDYQYHGSVYGMIPAKRGFQKPVGEWNSEEIFVKGDKIRVILNGNTIVNTNLKKATKNGTIDHLEHPGLNRHEGYIGFLGHGTIVRFRNVRIKDLSVK